MRFHTLKKFVFSTILLLLLGMSFMKIGSAYEPENTRIITISYTDELNLEKVVIATIINITVVIKNFTNESLLQLNVTQKMPAKIELISTPLGEYIGSEINLTQEKTYIGPTNEEIQILNGFANSSFYKFALSSLPPHSSLLWQYTINITSIEQFEINSPNINYLDKYGDSKEITNLTPISIRAQQTDSKDLAEQNFPQFELEIVNWFLISILALSVVIIAILSSYLHKLKIKGRK